MKPALIWGCRNGIQVLCRQSAVSIRARGWRAGRPSCDNRRESGGSRGRSAGNFRRHTVHDTRKDRQVPCSSRGRQGRHRHGLSLRERRSPRGRGGQADSVRRQEQGRGQVVAPADEAADHGVDRRQATRPPQHHQVPRCRDRGKPGVHRHGVHRWPAARPVLQLRQDAADPPRGEHRLQVLSGARLCLPAGRRASRHQAGQHHGRPPTTT